MWWSPNSERVRYSSANPSAESPRSKTGLVLARVVIEEVGDEVFGDAAVAGVAGVTVVAVMISESGSTAMWPL